MKIELEDSDIERIVERLFERLKPLLSNSHDSEDSKVMGVKELAGYLNVSKSWVYTKNHQNAIPYYKIGKYPRYKKGVILESGV